MGSQPAPARRFYRLVTPRVDFKRSVVQAVIADAVLDDSPRGHIRCRAGSAATGSSRARRGDSQPSAQGKYVAALQARRVVRPRRDQTTAEADTLAALRVPAGLDEQAVDAERKTPDSRPDFA